MKKKIALLTITVLIVAMFASCGVAPAKLQYEEGWRSVNSYMYSNNSTINKLTFDENNAYTLKRVTELGGAELCVMTGTYKLDGSTITMTCTNVVYDYNGNATMWAELSFPLKGETAEFQAKIDSSIFKMSLTLTDKESNDFSFYYLK